MQGFAGLGVDKMSILGGQNVDTLAYRQFVTFIQKKEANMEYIRKSFTFEGKRYYVRGRTEAEAIKKMVLKEKELEEGKITVGSNMLVKDWAYRAVEAYKTNQKEVTRQTYIQRMRHCVLEVIGDMQLKSVKPLHCQNVLNMQAGKSRAHINEVAQILFFIFDKAVDNSLISSNPAAKLTKPAGTKTHRRAITETEREYLLRVCDVEPRFTLFLLMLYCGCRPSEAMEAQGRDIVDIDGYPTLHIRGTKTANADRFVPIPDTLYQKIKNTPKFEYLCPNQAGHKHNQKSYQRVCQHLRRELNISMGCRVYRNQLIPPYPLADDFVPYNLRHTFCTDLQKQGIDIRTAQYLMGHADIQMTANIYTHADNSTVVEAAKVMCATQKVAR